MQTAKLRQKTANFGQTVPPCTLKTVPPWEKRKGGTVYALEIVVFWLFLASLYGRDRNKKPFILTEYERFVLLLSSFVLDALRYGRDSNPRPPA